MNRVLTDADKLKIVQLCEQGIEPLFIAERFGINRETVYRIYMQYKKSLMAVERSE